MSDVDDINLDLGREARMGLPEAILCSSKSTAQLERILEKRASSSPTAPLLLTRLLPEQHRVLSTTFALDYDDVSGTGYFQWAARSDVAVPVRIAVVSAGTSDIPVAKEAVRTLAFHHVTPLEVYDVGVAGLHRYLARAEELRACDVVIAVAGMDAALVSVVGGDVAGVVVAVPTSVGYGVATGGTSALHSSLASCASGVVVVNIDNGYGGACAALRIAGVVRRAQLRA